jgi:cysteine synthase A
VVAEKLAAERGWFLARQFDNPANPAYHRQTTGPEILADFASSRLDYWVTGWGTGGTLTGAGQMIKRARPEVKIVVCEPAEAAMLGGAEWRPHKIQGWTPDFVPSVLDKSVFDERIPVTDAKAIATARELGIKEGIFCGISAGATFSAALEVARRAPVGSVILAMFPDTGERYLSTVLFEGVPTGSDTV